MPNKIPIIKLNRPERLWLHTAYDLLKTGVKGDFKLIWNYLNRKIPDSFTPASMNPRLISPDGEYPRLLGIVALDKNYQILAKSNTVIQCVREVIIKDPKIENVMAAVVAAQTNLPLFETGMILNLIKEYGNFWTGAQPEPNNFCFKSIRVAGNDDVFYQYRRFTNIQGDILQALHQDAVNKKILLKSPMAKSIPPIKKNIDNGNFVDEKRLTELKNLPATKFDFRRLIQLCIELNSNFMNENYLSVAMIGRTILHHIPPVFDCPNFDSVANNYGGAKQNVSFKKIMKHLNSSLINIADNSLHQQIRQNDILPNQTQVDFRGDLDVLLAEIIRISRNPAK